MFGFRLWGCCCNPNATPEDGAILDEDGHAILDELGDELESE